MTEAMATEQMLVLVRKHDAEQTLLERDVEERRRRGVGAAWPFASWLVSTCAGLKKSGGPSRQRCATTASCSPSPARRTDVVAARLVD
jgi:hypothetical protein